MISNLVFIRQNKYPCYSLGPLPRLRCILFSYYSSSLSTSISKGLRDRVKTNFLLSGHLQPLRSSGFGSVDAEDLDAVAVRMKGRERFPVPRTSRIHRLRIHSVIPSSILATSSSLSSF